MISRTKIYLTIALTIAVMLAFFSGWREIGIDRNNYIAMYRGVVSSDEWSIKFWYAKDILFLVFVSISSYLSDDAKLSFLAICTVSILLKYFSVLKLAHRYTLWFVLGYALFLSPGLEFAAMRAGLAIGFLMLSLAHRDRKIIFFLFSSLAIAAHISTLLVVILCVSSVNRFLSKNKWAYVFISLVISTSGQLLLDIFPRGVDYAENQGTIFALFEPLATLFIAWLLFNRIDQNVYLSLGRDVAANLLFIRQIVYGLIFVAFGLTGVVVTASTRYLEISWCLLLLVAIATFRKSYVNMLGCSLLLALLAYLNIVRFTWVQIISPAVGA